MIAVVDVEAPGGKLQYLGKELPVRPALVEVVLAAAEIIEAGSHAALRRGATLAYGILGERRVNAGMHMGVDHPGEGEPALAVIDGFRFSSRNIFFDLREFLALDADVRCRGGILVRPHHAHVLYEEVVLHRFARCARSPPSRTICMR